MGGATTALKVLAASTLSLASLGGPVAQAARVPTGATWTEEYFESSDGTRLHADVLRPKGLPEDARTPVILSIGPYFNKSGELVEYDPVAQGPSDRFFDLLEEGRVFERGYAFVMVDLPGFGGSAGCHDWGGPSEQAAVKSAVEWSGSRPWSTGRVGVYGMSYDGWTGTMAIAQRPRHLAAVVTMEPGPDGYRYLYENRVRYANALIEGLYALVDAKPGPVAELEYNLNGADANVSRPGCYAFNYAAQQSQDPEDDYWKPRNVIPRTAGATTPTFLTQGFLEDNTKPHSGMFEMFSGLRGPKRAWFGQFDHVEGNDRDANGRPLTGREGFVDEVMRFYDRYVKGLPPGEAPTHMDAPVAVQQPDGRWRAEAQWPPEDSQLWVSSLNPGSYVDERGNHGTPGVYAFPPPEPPTGGPTGRGIWTFSQPLEHPAMLSGVPRLDLTVSEAAADANLVVNVYDVDTENRATLVHRGAMLLPGPGRFSVELYGQDWPLAPGHRIGVLLSAANDEWWLHTPTGAPVNVTSAGISLPFLRYERTTFIDGGPSPKLLSYLENAPFAVAPETIAGNTKPFELPPPLARGEAPGAGSG